MIIADKNLNFEETVALIKQDATANAIEHRNRFDEECARPDATVYIPVDGETEYCITISDHFQDDIRHFDAGYISANRLLSYRLKSVN